MEYKLSILHAYRHLLRAATYLPDSLARVRIHNEIVNRFRKRSKRLPSTTTTTSSSPSKILRTLETHTGRLSRAADFHAPDLESILRFTYGRKGSRRRVLLDLLRRTPPGEDDVLPDADALESFISSSSSSSSSTTTAALDRKPENSPKLTALLRSQKENQAQFERTRIKDLAPLIPEENIWGRKTPVKARRNLEKRWWAKTLKKVSPPVEEGEWDRLRDLAQGALVELVPARRTMTGKTDVHPPPPPETGDDAFAFASALGDCMSRVRGPRLEKVEILSKRGLRRLYSAIWSQTPTMAWDPVGKTWDTRWGVEFAMSKAGLEAVPRATGSAVELFEGVDELPSVEMDRQARRKGKMGRKEKEKEKERVVIES